MIFAGGRTSPPSRTTGAGVAVDRAGGGGGGSALEWSKPPPGTTPVAFSIPVRRSAVAWLGRSGVMLAGTSSGGVPGLGSATGTRSCGLPVRGSASGSGTGSTFVMNVNIVDGVGSKDESVNTSGTMITTAMRSACAAIDIGTVYPRLSPTLIDGSTTSRNRWPTIVPPFAERCILPQLRD